MRRAAEAVADWNRDAGQMDGVTFAPNQRLKNPVYEDGVVMARALAFIKEEVLELQDALLAKDEVEVVDAICDILFTTLGVAAKAGVSHIVENAFDEVCRSNETKLLGNYKKSAEKTGKSEHYRAPDIPKMIAQSDELRGLLLQKEDELLTK